MIMDNYLHYQIMFRTYFKDGELKCASGTKDGDIYKLYKNTHHNRMAITLEYHIR